MPSSAVWVWDNTEPVTGFPAGTPSAWTESEQDQIADFLRDLAQQTKCKVLVSLPPAAMSGFGWAPCRPG